MTQRGYLYVLANSSIPDLVKVGKTSRHPSLRAQELSSSTGIPTPFIVVFERYFEDCQVAEDFVHTTLTRKGYRLSENREFFRAPVSEVIKSIKNAPGGIDDADSTSALQDSQGPDFFESRAGDEMDNWTLESYEKRAPWEDVLQEADCYYYGIGDYLRDYQEAMALYKEAAKLGSLAAYERIGDMFRYGEGVAEDKLKALEWYKVGARKGNYYCYIPMAELFRLDNNLENFEKCIRLFFQNRKQSPNSHLEQGSQYAHTVLRYLRICQRWKMNVSYMDEVREIRDELIRVGQQLQAAHERTNANTKLIQENHLLVQWLQQI